MTGCRELLHEMHERFAAASLCYGHGTDNAWDEAVALLLGVTGLPDEQSSLELDLSEDQVAAIREFARRRIDERRPLAHLLGEARYCGEVFDVPDGIVVPRSPIGPLLLDGLERWIEAPARVLDLCCGSGCLGILAAMRYPKAQVIVADIDPLAVATAQRNIAARGLDGRVTAIRSDLFAEFESDVPEMMDPPNAVVGVAEGLFDLILCNPPYVDANEMAKLPTEFAREPVLGLAGGSDGLAVMNRVIEQVSRFLTEDGVLIGEVGEGAERLETRWPRLPLFWPDLPAGGSGVFLLRAADAP